MAAIEAETLASELRGANRRALAKAITLIESTREADREAARHLLGLLVPHAGNSIRLGISGVPGVGKSTFIEALGNHLIDTGHKVAVLAVDASSARTGGSILGDKTRMETLSRRRSAFIRPSPAGGTLGGVTRNTRDSVIAVEAAGFDVVLVETVGVGQSETAVAAMTDMFLLMLLPGGGDELQGIKRGITELADMIVINKADGDLAAAAARTAADCRSALRFLRPRTSGWEVPVLTCSALNDANVDEIWNVACRFRDHLDKSDGLQKERANQARASMWSEIRESLVEQFKTEPAMAAPVRTMEEAVAAGRRAATAAAHELLERFYALRRGKTEER